MALHTTAITGVRYGDRVAIEINTSLARTTCCVRTGSPHYFDSSTGGSARALQAFHGMSKTSAKANPKNQDDGDHNRGSEPGQENQRERRDRQNMGAGKGTRIEGENQGRTRRGQGRGRDATREKGDARRGRTK